MLELAALLRGCGWDALLYRTIHEAGDACAAFSELCGATLVLGSGPLLAIAAPGSQLSARQLVDGIAYASMVAERDVDQLARIHAELSRAVA